MASQAMTDKAKEADELEERIQAIEKRLGIRSKAEKERLKPENNRLQGKGEVIYDRRRHP